MSWSGELSKAVALAFRDWLPLVVHNAEVFVSEEDIDKGTRPLARIAEELEETDCGILSVTRRNADRPWVNYEAGALSKKVGESRVMPFLVDLEYGDLPRHNPLSQFQTTNNEKNDIRRMIQSINNAVAPPVSPSTVVDRLFEAVWVDLEAGIAEAISCQEEDAETPASPSVGIMVAEMLDLVRSQQREVSDLRAELRRIDQYRNSEIREPFLRMSDKQVAAWSEDLRIAESGLIKTLGRQPTVEEIATALGFRTMEFVEMDILMRTSGHSQFSERPITHPEMRSPTPTMEE
jgi:hypothetical protein